MTNSLKDVKEKKMKILENIFRDDQKIRDFVFSRFFQQPFSFKKLLRKNTRHPALRVPIMGGTRNVTIVQESDIEYIWRTMW